MEFPKVFQRVERDAAHVQMTVQLLLFLFVIAVDQFSKYVAEKVTLVSLNTGVSFRFFSTPSQDLITVLLICVLLMIGVVWRRLWRRHLLASIVFFAAASSNILDRVLYHGVRDWISLPGIDLKNNLADWLICISVFLIVIQRSHTDRKP